MLLNPSPPSLHRFSPASLLLWGNPTSLRASNPRRCLLGLYRYGGPGEISWSKDEQLPAASVPNTVLPRLDIGRCVAEHACPDRPALRGFTCVRCCGKPRASIPHALAGKTSTAWCPPWPRAVASSSWLPPTGSIKDLHLQLSIHVQRTQSGYALLPFRPPPPLLFPTSLLSPSFYLLALYCNYQGGSCLTYYWHGGCRGHLVFSSGVSRHYTRPKPAPQSASPPAVATSH